MTNGSANRTTILAATMLSMSAFATGPALADWDEAPPLDEFTEFAFEGVDIGFCNMQELGLSDAEFRAALAEAEDVTWLHGDATLLQDTPVHGSGLFTYRDSGNAIVTTMHAYLVPDDGPITLLCLVLLPVDNPGAVEGEFALNGFSTFHDQTEPDPSYAVLGKLIGRDAEGEDVDLAYLQNALGELSFVAEDDTARRQPEGGDTYISVSFGGVLSDGRPIALDFNSALFESEHMNAMYLTTP